MRLGTTSLHTALAHGYPYSYRFAMPPANASSSSPSPSQPQWVWTRTYTNYPMHLAKMERVVAGAYPIASANRYDIAAVRREIVKTGACTRTLGFVCICSCLRVHVCVLDLPYLHASAMLCEIVKTSMYILCVCVCLCVRARVHECMYTFKRKNI